MSIDDFGTLSDGRAVHSVTLQNDHLTARFLTLGALIQDVRLSGVDFSLTLGGRTATDYEGVMSHFGAIMGPVANRLTGARADIDGTEYRFDPNQDGLHTLHGGKAAIHRRIWSIDTHDPTGVTFYIQLQDGDGGFPGARRIEARYALDGATLTMDLRAATNTPTLLNLANHAYWTMQPPEDWSGQMLQIHADRYLPTDEANLPTGQIATVEGTPYDFRKGVVMDAATAGRLDHNFCLADAPRTLTPALRLSGPTGLTLDLATTAPGLQVFDMGSFAVSEDTLHGHGYPPRAAFAFEPQHWPDAPDNPDFPSIILRPGAVYAQRTTYTFAQ